MLQFSLLCWALAGLALAQDNCKKSSPEIALPSCMVSFVCFWPIMYLTNPQDKCFQTDGCGSCPCPNNLKGWCEMSSEGPSSWFARWGQCVLGDCPDDGDITSEL